MKEQHRVYTISSVCGETALSITGLFAIIIIIIIIIIIGALFCISVYSGFKCFPSPLDTTAITVLPHNFRNSSLVTCYLPQLSVRSMRLGC